MYNFLFDKKSLYLLLGGLGLAGILLFFSGLLVGVQVGLPAAAAAYTPPSLPAKPSAKAVELPGDRPCVPCAEVAAAPPEPVAPPATEMDVNVEEPAPEPAPPVVEEPRVQVASLPAPALLAPSRTAAVTEEAAFSVQVGAFSRPENSAKVIRDLESRGYQPYVVELPGSRRRLRTVRIGRYADREEARKAAAALRQREGIAAVVIGS